MKRLQTLWFDDVAKDGHHPTRERSHDECPTCGQEAQESSKLGSVNIIHREAYADLELDAKVELIRSLVPLGLMHVQELLDQEVTALASERYVRKTRRSVDAVTAVTLGRWVSRGSACRFACPGFERDSAAVVCGVA